MSWLTGLGSLAGGFDQTFAPLLQQYQQNVAVGQGIAAMYGQSPDASTQQGGGSGVTAPPNVPVQAPQTMLGQGGVARSPTPQPVAVNAPAPTPISGAPAVNMPSPTAMPTQASGPSPLPSTAPRTASAGQQGIVPGQNVAAPPAASPQAQQTAAQPSATLTAQQNQPRQGPDLSHFDGQFDFNTLMQSVLRHNMRPNGTIDYEKVGRIANAPAFERMLTQQGLNQYRALNLGNQMNRTGIMEDKLNLEAEKFGETTKRLEANQVAAQKREALNKAEGDLKFTYGQQNQRLLFGPSVDASGKPIDKQAAAKKLDDDLAAALAKIQKQRESLQSDSSPGGGKTDDNSSDYGMIKGKMYHYKGNGDRGDMASWEPVN